MEMVCFIFAFVYSFWEKLNVYKAMRFAMNPIEIIFIGIVDAVEIGPGNILAGLAKRTTPQIAVKNINSVEAILNR